METGREAAKSSHRSPFPSRSTDRADVGGSVRRVYGHPREPDPWRLWPPAPDSVEAAQLGDQDVMKVILTAAIPKLVSFYRGQGMTPHDAEDLAGDACEAVVRTLPKLRDAGRFEPWFWRIARSKLYDHLRAKRKPGPRPTEVDEMFSDPSDLLLIADEHASVRSAFAVLKPRDRELLWMRDVVGLPYSDMARRFQLREGAIRIAVMRARERLEKALSAQDDVDR